MQSELRPRHDLEQLFKRAESSRHRDEAVRQLRHESLPFVHVVRDAEIGHAGVQQFLRRQELRDDSNHKPVRRQHRIRNRSHQPDAATTIDQFNLLTSHQRSQLTRRASVYDIKPGAGTTEDAKAMKVGHGVRPAESLTEPLAARRGGG